MRLFFLAAILLSFPCFGGTDSESITYSSADLKWEIPNLDGALGGRTRTFVSDGWYRSTTPEKCGMKFLSQITEGLLGSLDSKRVYFGFLNSCQIGKTGEPVTFQVSFAVQALTPQDSPAVLHFLHATHTYFGNTLHFSEVDKVVSRFYVAAGIMKGNELTSVQNDFTVRTFPSLIDFDHFAIQIADPAFKATDPESFVDFMGQQFAPAVLRVDFESNYPMAKVNFIQGYHSPVSSMMPFPSGSYLLKDGSTAMAVGRQPMVLVRDCRKSATGYCR